MPSSRFGCDHDVMVKAARVGPAPTRHSPIESRKKARGRTLQEKRPWIRLEAGGARPSWPQPMGARLAKPCGKPPTSSRCRRRNHDLERALQAGKASIALSATSGIVLQSDRRSAFGALWVGHRCRLAPFTPVRAPDSRPCTLPGRPNLTPSVSTLGSLNGSGPCVCNTWQESRGPGGRHDSAARERRPG